MSYLDADGVFLPTSCAGTYNQDFSSDGSEDGVEVDPAEPGVGVEFNFEQLEANIVEKIRALGGSVVPKLNWSSPRDALWVNASSLRCSTPAEIFTLLKSSDNISHDCESLRHCQAQPENGVRPMLVLREWLPLSTFGLFRCFVVNNCLIAGCQRDRSNFYSELPTAIEDLSRKIARWYKNKLRPRTLDLTDFVFDIHCPVRGRVVLLDLDEFGEAVDPIMFTWEELDQLRSTTSTESTPVSDPDLSFRLRIVEEQSPMLPSTVAITGLPFDFTSQSNTEDMVSELREAIRQQGAETEGQG